MGAIEEIILEFGAPDVLDTAERRLGTFTLVLVLQIRFLDPSCKFNLKN